VKSDPQHFQKAGETVVVLFEEEAKQDGQDRQDKSKAE
jgi:hypothetical protein